jgi:hypothetical protein
MRVQRRAQAGRERVPQRVVALLRAADAVLLAQVLDAQGEVGHRIARLPALRRALDLSPVVWYTCRQRNISS